MFGLNSNKLKVQCQLCLSRLKLSRNKHEVTLRKERHAVADLLKTPNQANARIRVETVIREEMLLRAYMLIENYLLLISTRAEYLAKSKEIPVDMVDAVTSLLFVANRVQGDLDEMKTIFKMLMPKAQTSFKEYRDFAAQVVDDHAAGQFGVNPDLISCLSVMPPSPEEKIVTLADIAQEHGMEFDKEKATQEMVPANRIPKAFAMKPTAAAPSDGNTWSTGTTGGGAPPADRWPRPPGGGGGGGNLWVTEHPSPYQQSEPQGPAYISQPPPIQPSQQSPSRPVIGKAPSRTGWEPLKPVTASDTEISGKFDSTLAYLQQRHSSSTGSGDYSVQSGAKQSDSGPSPVPEDDVYDAAGYEQQPPQVQLHSSQYPAPISDDAPPVAKPAHSQPADMDLELYSISDTEAESPLAPGPPEGENVELPSPPPPPRDAVAPQPPPERPESAEDELARRLKALRGR